MIDRIFVNNWRGVFATIRAFAPALKASGDGLIVNVSSIAAFTGIGSNVAYCGAKAGVDMITRVLALEWAGWAFAEGFSNAVNALVGMPLLLQGLCVVDFMLARSPKNATLGRALTYTGIGILFSLAQTPLILIGCFEQIFRFRDRMRGVPPRAAI